MVKTNQEKAINAYDCISDDYSEISQKNKNYINSINKLVLKYIIQKKVIDIGSGDGSRISFLYKEGNVKELVCLEPSKGMYKKLKKVSNIKALNLYGQDKLDLYESYFDVVTSLWNVLGHVGSENDFFKTLLNARSYLKPNGVFILDVNNRLNALAYGKLTALYRFIVDLLFFDRKRGDVNTKWNINGKNIYGYGHVFSPFEIKKSLKKAGFKILKVKYVNYKNGSYSNNIFSGQIFIVAQNICY